MIGGVWPNGEMVLDQMVLWFGGKWLDGLRVIGAKVLV